MPATPRPEAPYDPLDPTHNADPAGRLAQARVRCPVSETRPGVFVVARHADVRDILTDPAAFSSMNNFTLGDGAEAAGPPTPFITMMDPPDHTALRGRLRRWFSPGRLRRQEGSIREIVTEILDEWRPGQQVEILAALARPVPARTVYSLLGLPRQDWERLQGWSDVINSRLPQVPPDLPELAALAAYLGNLVGTRSAGPATDDSVLDGLVHPAAGEAPLTPTEVIAHVLQLIAAGTDTTSSLIANLLHELLVDPDRWERLLADRALIPRAIEESLRHDAPLQYVLRTVTTGRDVAGCPVAPDDRLVLSLQSANWDEQAWGSDAADYSLHRPPGQAALMSFGYGIHTCLGAPLARLEAQVILEQLLERFPRMRLAPAYRREPLPGVRMVRRPVFLDVVL